MYQIYLNLQHKDIKVHEKDAMRWQMGYQCNFLKFCDGIIIKWFLMNEKSFYQISWVWILSFKETGF